MNAKLAELAVIRHRCECASATEPPGENGVEHVFTLDGVEFPWHISEEGPRVRRLPGHENVEGGYYAIDVTIVVRNVELDGVEITE